MTNAAAAKHTPGPWFIEPLGGEVFAGGSQGGYCLTRHNPDGQYEFESMETSDGSLAKFATRDEARAAISKATGSAQ